MASGKQHAETTKRNIKLLLPVAVAATVLGQPVALVVIPGLVVGHLLTPDIDHHHWTHEEWRICRFNRLLGWLWHLYWTPYAYFHKHRGGSHAPILGTLGRFCYLCWLPFLASVYAPEWVWLCWIGLFIGWVIQDVTHLYYDGLLWGRGK